MPGGQHLGAQLLRRLEQVAKLDRLVALDARDRCFAGEIAVCEAVDYGLLETILVVEHVVRNADPLGDSPRIVDILTGATGSLAMGGRAMIVKLQRDAND